MLKSSQKYLKAHKTNLLFSLDESQYGLILKKKLVSLDQECGKITQLV